MVKRTSTIQPGDLNPSIGYTRRFGLFGFLVASVMAANEGYQAYQANQIHDRDRQKITSLNNELTQAQATSQATIARLELDIEKIKADNETQQKSISSTKQGLAKQNKTLEDLAKTTTNQGLDIKDLKSDNEKSDTNTTRTNQEMVTLKTEISSLQDRGVSKLYKKAVKSVVGLHLKYETEGTDDKGNKKKTIGNQAGTGVVIAHIDDGKKGGYIITNWHNVNHDGFNEDNLKNLELDVTLPNGSTTKAKQHFYTNEKGELVAARDEKCDLTLLVVTSDISTTNPIEVSMVEPVPGDPVIVIGNPFMLQNSVSRGIVSGLRTVSFLPGKIEVDPPDKTKRVSVVQTDAAINSGNSGGAGITENDGKLLFMPTYIIAHGIGMGATSQEMIIRSQNWIPYKVNASGRLVKIEK